MPELNLTATPLFVIAGPCVIESADQCLRIAEHVHGVCDRLGLTYVFKASFDKANRSSTDSFRGPGLDDGLAVLDRVKRATGLAVLTDVHEPAQAAAVGQVVDVLQVPAFLARQTRPAASCGRTGRTINIKKGQFMSPQEMRLAVDKVAAVGNADVLLTERGTFFGYNRLVNDFTGLAVMREIGKPVVFDVTHSTQQPGRPRRHQRREPAVRPAAGPGGRRRRRRRPVPRVPPRPGQRQERRGHGLAVECRRAAAAIVPPDCRPAGGVVTAGRTPGAGCRYKYGSAA